MKIEEAKARMEMLRQQYEGALLTTQAIDMAIEALTYKNLSKPKNTCEVDLISREDAVKRLLLFKQSKAKSVSSYDTGFVDGLSHAINIVDLVPVVYIPSINTIDLAPSAADRPTGEWIEEDEYDDLWVCDQCGFASEYKDNFCPNCGAKMKGEEHEIDRR